MHGPWSMIWLKGNWEADGRCCMFFHTEASINGVQGSGPEAISSVKICAFQWPFGAAVVCCLARVRFSAMPAG